jgi:RNA polymerase sigma-70 factor (ECF subfamily)
MVMVVRPDKFEEIALPHLQAAYNLARWLTRNDKDAEDVVQEAYLRAYKHFGTFCASDARPWLLAIVRNTYRTWIHRNRFTQLELTLEDETFQHPQSEDPEMLLLKEVDKQILRKALRRLPIEFLEVIVLREFEQMSYKQISEVVEIPLGTVMSRLARARRRLAELVSNCHHQATSAELVV